MKNIVISLISVLMKSLSPEMLKDVTDKLLDFIEDKVQNSPSKIDDMLVLPLCKTIRDAFGIEDND